jgi:signal transduction histidine kinase
MAVGQTAKPRFPQANRVTPDDRVRIGQEIHDLIGHKLSVMVLHATALELAGGPAAGRAAAIRETGCAAIAGLRHIVESLCDESALDPAMPSLRAAVDTLAEASRNAGLPIEIDLGDGVDELGSDVGEVVFCVVREALTNVHKHAGLVQTTVRATARAGSVVVEVDNRRPTTPPVTTIGGSRRGLRGMRKLLDRHAGVLSYGCTPDGGFRVRAELPVNGTSEALRRGAM